MATIAKKTSIVTNDLKESMRSAAMHVGNSVYVLPYQDNWAIKKEGKINFSGKFTTKGQALEAAHAIGHEVRVIVYEKDGSFVEG